MNRTVNLSPSKRIKKRHNSVIAAVKFNSRSKLRCEQPKHNVNAPMETYNFPMYRAPRSSNR